MASTEIQESSALLEATDFDSESSSSDDRGTNKRLGADLESTGPKKRRKQTTPVRFPACLMVTDRTVSEEEEDDENADTEGKMLNSSQAKSLHAQAVQDENQDTINQCHLCHQSFDDKSTLEQHLECEHYVSTKIPQQLHTKAANLIKTELDVGQFPEQTTSPVNLSSISIKNFASWMPVQSSAQTQKDEWPVNPPRLPLPEHIQSIPSFPNALTQYLHYPGFPLSDVSTMHPRSSLGPVQPRIFNRDAYCDLCNKEFCNKYFLKTHKANKHGIYSDTSSQGSSGETAAVGPVSFPSNFVKSESQVQHPDSNTTSPFAVSPSPSFSCDVCQKRFKCDELVRKHKQKFHEKTYDSTSNVPQQEDKKETNSSQSPSVMEMLFKQEYSMEQEDSSLLPPQRHQIQQTVQLVTESGLSIEQLRKLGVINSETFCDICCKEFTNKFFLRAHKLKRHGMVLQNNEKLNTSSGSWHHIQTSPLNLIVNDSVNNFDSEDREEEHECRICGIHFQTAELYDIHQQRVHDEKPKSPINDPDSSNHKSDAISEDLQKLQTMILQLNGLESQKKETLCTICGSEFENKAILQMHMSTEHDLPIDNSPTSQDIEKSPTNTITYCNTCDKDFLNEEALKRHISEDHLPSTSSSLNLPQIPTTPVTTVAKSSQSERKPPSSMTPTSSYCEICNKELCNKYFMKTHMHRMHGIEISNGAQIGGVICNICNKELCSKYFLRVHKHNTHGIIDESASTPMKQETSFDASSSEDNSLKPEHPNDMSNRYFSHFTEVCPICSRRFRSVKWLKAHLLGDHGKAGVEKWREFEEQYPVTRIGLKPPPPQSSPNLKIPNGQDILNPQNKIGDFAALGTQVLSNLFSSSDDQRSKGYRCSMCNFTTTALPFLFLHERTHTNPQGNEGNQSLQCPICSQIFPKLEILHHHLLSSHQFPSMLSQLQSPMLNNFSNKESKENTLVETKVERKQDQVGYGNESEPVIMQKTEPANIEVTPQGAYKCAQCGFATANLNRIKKHVKKDHKSIGDATDSVITELSRTLKEVASKHKLPATYAMPQDLNSNPDKTIMQPFLIEEFDAGVQGVDDCSPIKRFAPALVYLPVKARVNTILTASFTLSPA